MKNVIQGWVLILDMYYYRKRLMKRYYNIKYYERHRVLKVDSIGFFDNLSDSFTSVYNFCFKSNRENETKKLNDAIKKECERNDNRRLFIEARVKNKIGRFEDWDNTQQITDRNLQKILSTDYNRHYPSLNTGLDIHKPASFS